MARRSDVRYIQYYTNGSAAHKIAPVVPMQTMELPKVRKKKRISVSVDPLALAGIALAALMAVLMVVGIARLQKAQANVLAMESYVEVLREENARLHAEFESGYDLAEVEETALALGMVPAEQTTTVTLRIPETVPQEQTPGAWERIYAFLTGLFA